MEIGLSFQWDVICTKYLALITKIGTHCRLKPKVLIEYFFVFIIVWSLESGVFIYECEPIAQ